MSTLVLEVGNDAEQAAQATEQLTRAIAEAGWQTSECFRVAVCISEVLTNILRHAELGTRQAALRLRISARGLVLRIRDHGRAFEALETSPVSQASLAENGRGLAILSGWCDAQRRYRRDGLNTQLLFFSSPRPASAQN